MAFLLLLAACAARKPLVVNSSLNSAAGGSDMLALSDALEALIAVGQDTPADREYAYEVVRTHDEDTAAATYARAAVTGRYVQERGLRKANLIPEIEEYARRSRKLDPDFRNGAAARLLGTLYVVAPAYLLEYGDSETGLDLLEGLVAAHPEDLQNHLRVAEAYITLSDPVPARPHLCRCLAGQARLRPDEQTLVRYLVANAGTLSCTDSGTPAPGSETTGENR